MASATTTYNFTDEEVSHLANCNDQDDFLYNSQRILPISDAALSYLEYPLGFGLLGCNLSEG